jgi:AcrR family transcriptional regulator
MHSSSRHLDSAQPVGTRERVLTIATDLFAQHGYRGATVRAICSAAGVNVASVNYHFRSKQDLYQAVFEAAFDERARPVIGQVDLVHDAGSWQQTLREWVLFMLRLMLRDTPQETRIRRLFAYERTSPSGACGLLFERFFQPVTASLERLLRMALPADAGEDEVRAWLISTLGQCTVFLHRDPPWDDLLLCAGVDRETWIERIADQIVNGITARLQYRHA